MSSSSAFNGPLSKSDGSRHRQILYCLVVSSSSMCLGMVTVWTNVLPKLLDDKNSFSLTELDIQWIVSIPGLVGIPISIITGPLVEYFGPKRLLQINLLFISPLWLLLAFTPYLSLFYIGRIGLSVNAYVISTFIQPYLAELCQTEIRGAMGFLPQIMLSFSILLSYVLTHFFSWKVATALSAAPFIPIFLFSLFVPESPYWLVRNSKQKEAETVIRQLHGSQANVEKELLRDITSIDKANTTVCEQIKLLRKKENLRPLLLLVCIRGLRELGGQNAVFSYSVFIFREAGVEMDAFLCAVLLGIIRFIFTIISACFIDRIGRRPFFIVTTLVCSASECLCGGFLVLDFKSATWVPLVGILVFVASFGLGQGPIPWLLVGELLPTPIRSTGASIVMLSASLFLFISNYVFPWTMSLMGLGGTMFLFAFLNIVSVIISYIYLPETRGKSLQELETAFS